MVWWMDRGSLDMPRLYSWSNRMSLIRLCSGYDVPTEFSLSDVDFSK